MLYNDITIGGELYHYGVKGMKWGIRRYQPYGQGYSKSTGKYIGPKSGLNKQGYQLKFGKNRTDEQVEKQMKKALGSAAFMAGVSVAAGLITKNPKTIGFIKNPIMRKEIVDFCKMSSKMYPLVSAMNLAFAGKEFVTLAKRQSGSVGQYIKDKTKKNNLNEQGSIFNSSDTKKNFNDLKKSYKKGKPSWSMPYSAGKEFSKDVTEKAKRSVSKEELNELKRLKKQRDDFAKFDDFYDSDYYEKAREESYNKTFNYIRKNDPEYLNQIIKNNGGSKKNLNDFHDFRKIYEGFTDELSRKYQSQWYKSKEGQKSRELEKQYIKANGEYRKAREQIVDKIVGEYGNKKINGEMFRDIISNNIDYDELLNTTRKK